jgi:hypothetical protein
MQIEKLAFYGCSNLKNIIIPNSVTHIGEMAFQNCGIENAIELKNIKILGQ